MADPETTGIERADYATRFKPGNPGRPKGSRNKLSEDFFKALAADFAQHGQAAIETMRTEKPNEYAKMVASLQTKEVEANVSVGLAEALDALDDDAG